MISKSAFHPTGGDYATSDLDDARTHMASIFRPHQLNLLGGMGAIAMRHEWMCLERCDLHWLGYGAPVVMSADAMEHFHLFQINLSGNCEVKHGRETVIVNPMQCYSVDRTKTLSKIWSSDCRQLIIQVGRTEFDRFVEDEMDGYQRGNLCFDFIPLPVTSALSGILDLAALIRTALTNGQPGLGSQRIVRHLETAMIATLLNALPHSRSQEYDRIPMKYAPFYVKRAEDYISTHLREPISIQDLEFASTVSARSLFNGFNRYRNMTPMRYIKFARLKLAYKELSASDPAAATVTEIAMNCGFTHMGNFANDFYNQFGTMPSTILRSQDKPLTNYDLIFSRKT